MWGTGTGKADGYGRMYLRSNACLKPDACCADQSGPGAPLGVGGPSCSSWIGAPRGKMGFALLVRSAKDGRRLLDARSRGVRVPVSGRFAVGPCRRCLPLVASLKRG
jgi:hypothetical protein